MLKRRTHPLTRVLRHPLFKSSAFLGAAAALLPGGSMLAWSHFVETRWLELTRHRVPLHGLERRLRLLHLSDLHFTREDPWMSGMVKRLEGIECDLAVITGDMVMPGFDPEAVRQLLRALPHPPLGLFLVPGNWEYWSGLRDEALEQLAQDTGMRLLLHDFQRLPGNLVLGGVDDELAGQPTPDALLDRLPADAPAIVLSHCPSLFPRLDRAPVQLVLSGHTHGGQIRLPGLGAVWLPSGSDHYDQGWFAGNHARLFVNRGFGTSLARLRFLCRPEAALLELEPTSVRRPT